MAKAGAVVDKALDASMMGGTTKFAIGVGKSFLGLNKGKDAIETQNQLRGFADSGLAGLAAGSKIDAMNNASDTYTKQVDEQKKMGLGLKSYFYNPNLR